MSDNLQTWDAFLSVASLSDIGMRRSNNQDNLSISMASNLEQWKRRGHLFIVADGMGAHAAGELASKLAVDYIPHLYAKYDDLPAAEALRKSVVDANTEIHKRGQANEEFHNMGTTCSVLLLSPLGAIVAHVGDSRVYRQRQNRLEQLTFDHSLVWEMKKNGQLTEAELIAGKIPRNVITRSLGPYTETKVDLEGPFPIMVNDCFLLCSDGLTGLVEDAEIGSLMANLPPEEAARVMVDLANLRGGHDNVTCVVVQVKNPLMATVAAGQATAAGLRSKQKSAVHPLTWAVLAGSLVLSILFLLIHETFTAVIPAGIFLAGLIWLVVQLIRAGADAERNGSQKLGEGPYVQLNCASGDELVIQLQSMTSQLIEVAELQDWKVDRDGLASLTRKAESTTGADAVRAYARCISFLMDQLRNQS